jgi:hypothetical protein
MSERRFITEAGHVAERPIPLEHLLITATASGSAQTFHTVRAGVMLKVKQLAVMNTDSSARTLTLNAIPSGGAIGTGNTELAVSIPANSASALTDYIGGLYAEGTVLKAYASAASVLVLHGWGEEVL